MKTNRIAVDKYIKALYYYKTRDEAFPWRTYITNKLPQLLSYTGTTYFLSSIPKNVICL